MDEQNPQHGPPSDDWYRLAPRSVLARGLIRVYEAGVHEPQRFQASRWGCVYWLLQFTGGFVTYLAVSRVIRVPILRHVVGIIVGFLSIPVGVWHVPSFGALLIIMGLPKGEYRDKQEPGTSQYR